MVVATPGTVAEAAPREIPVVEEDRRDNAQPDGLEAQRTISGSGPVYSVFSVRAKRGMILMATVAAFFSPFTANIYFPALNQLASQLHVTSNQIAFTITSYLIMQGLAPTFVGDFADSVGRRPAYLFCFILYIAASIGCALSPNFAALLVLRMLQSSGSSGTMSLASGVAADISVSSERGTYMGWAMSGTMTAPALGPIVGGLLANFLGWRAIFWFLTIIGGVTLLVLLLFLPETGRRIVGNGSKPPQPWNISLLTLLQRRRRTSQESAGTRVDESTTPLPRRKMTFPNPLGALRVLKEKDACLVLIFNSLNFTAYYQLTASLPYLLQRIYGFDTLQVGLSFIPLGVGCMLAPPVSGAMLDWNFRRVAKKAGIPIDSKRGNNTRSFPLEKARIPVLWPLALSAVVAEIIYGWVLEINAPLAAPLIMTFIMGLSFTATYNVSVVMLVDYYPQGPATATSAVNLCRCWLGAGGTAVIIYMIEGMGRGFCFTFIGLVLLATTPVLIILAKYGPGWRERRWRKLDDEARRKGEKALNAREGG